MSALWPVQEAIYERLSTDPALVAAGFKVFDEAPANYSARHITIGDGTEGRRNAFAGRGWDNTETVHVWTPGNDSGPARRAAALVIDAMEGSPLSLDGHTALRCRYEFGGTIKEPGWRHVPLRFRIWTRRTA